MLTDSEIEVIDKKRDECKQYSNTGSNIAEYFEEHHLWSGSSDQFMELIMDLYEAEHPWNLLDAALKQNKYTRY